MGAGSKVRRRMLAAANGIDRLITRLCRFVVLVTGIALTVILTGNVVARYLLASGGIDAAEEIPERLFPWFIVAGIALAAQAGGHMSVDWVLDRLGPRGRRWLLLARERDRHRSPTWSSSSRRWSWPRSRRWSAAPCSTCPTAMGTGPWRSGVCFWRSRRPAPRCGFA